MDEKNQPRQFIHSKSSISTEDGQHLFYIKNSSWPSSRPDVALHSGRDKRSPVAAVCELNTWSDDKIALGDPSKTGVKWIRFERHSTFKLEYQWSFIVSDIGQQTFAWKHTHSEGIDDHKLNGFSSGNYKMVETRTNRVIAVYNNGSIFSGRSKKFQINVNYGSDFDVLVLLTGCALLEKARRNSRSRTSASTRGAATAAAAC
ncbi:hypothetical protein EYB26_004128 [Talaromyces marneffei]|uniref:uncharacterized protein n=1 Tax=Talaromyces marneffei TaxID=37727 RepID=UPI0012A8F126|nr:uncharacterized protein EYB26_004128 [Talaromyces marneffei]QGA16461.1 hypothetical protein EYB26_004128 [Talaromyces marneffei]